MVLAGRTAYTVTQFEFTLVVVHVPREGPHAVRELARHSVQLVRQLHPPHPIATEDVRRGFSPQQSTPAVWQTRTMSGKPASPAAYELWVPRNVTSASVRLQRSARWLHSRAAATHPNPVRERRRSRRS